METHNGGKKSVRRNTFKSYYVVWKLFFENENIRPQSCLNRTMQYGNLFFEKKVTKKTIKFKSYYVVWKLIITNKMVYRKTKFKSYYVVWKPFSVVVYD